MEQEGSGGHASLKCVLLVGRCKDNLREFDIKARYIYVANLKSLGSRLKVGNHVCCSHTVLCYLRLFHLRTWFLYVHSLPGLEIAET